MSFKVGDRVKLSKVSKIYADSISINSVGKITYIINRNFIPPYPITVIWKEDIHSSNYVYSKEELVKIKQIFDYII